MPGAEATKRRRMPQSGKVADGKERGPDPIGRSSFKGFFLGGSIYSMLNGGQGRQLSPFGNAYLRSQVPPSKG